MNITAFLPLKVLLTALMMVFAVAESAAEKVRIVVLSTADIHGRTAQFRHAVAPTVAGELSRYGSNAVYHCIPVSDKRKRIYLF
jgi:2',3'-cyclic-nucleotide 2'-phosphodiesterase (5'-nucleotidase family)